MLERRAAWDIRTEEAAPSAGGGVRVGLFDDTRC